MHFDSGKLNRRITFIKYGETKNEIGQTVYSDTEIMTVWASVRPIRGYELSLAERLTPESIYTITTRYFPGITTDMRIRYNGKIFFITSVANIDEGNYALEITATEKRVV